MTARESFIALNMLPKIGPVKVKRLLERFGSADAILRANRNALSEVSGIGSETAKILAEWEDHIDLVREIEEVKQRGIQLITQDDENYPSALKESYDPPLVLYVWGDLLEKDKHAIAIVGSRRCSHYGIHSSRQISFQLATSGFTILSGLARGIDTHAHEGAIAAKGRTIAVIGSGLGQVYPPENMALAEKIVDGHGAVVSEFALHTPPSKKTFPMRNRIVAAWSQAVLVTECPSWSGALITANLAGELGRPIYAVPGQIDRPHSAGCNQLIREGATLVTGGQDILDDLSMLPFLGRGKKGEASKDSENVEVKESASSSPISLNKVEEAIVSSIEKGATLADEILVATALGLAELNASLLKLEMMGVVTRLPGGRFVKKIKKKD